MTTTTTTARTTSKATNGDERALFGAVPLDSANRLSIAPVTGDNHSVSQSQPIPPQRIGDAERDRAAEFLREHHAQGRLDPAEFDERITAALSAKWQSDLDRLFSDLPAPTPRAVAPAAPAAQPPVTQRSIPGLLSDKTRNAMDLLSVAIWPIAIAGMVLLHGRAGFLIFIAILVTFMWHRRRNQDNAARAQLERDAERRRLEQERRRHGNGEGPWGQG